MSTSCQTSPRSDASLTTADPNDARPATALAAAAPMTPAERARELAQRFVIVDGHIDVPYRLYESRAQDGALTEDIAGATAAGNFDYPRARAGGLDAPFFSIYVPTSYQRGGGAKKFADGLIDMVEDIVRRSPDKFALASSPEAVRANHAAGQISLALGIENGAALEGNLANVAHFYRRGVRYITLTHAADNDLGDSSSSRRPKWHGLSPLGQKVVAEMNRVGILVDVSHVSDETFFDVLAASKTPVIASHSSCRHFTPTFTRNLTDPMIRALGKDGGVVMINFGSSFAKGEFYEHVARARRAVARFAKEQHLADTDERVRAFRRQYREANPPVEVTAADVADHIDHVVKLVGIDHVGLGSDFDGVGENLPVDLDSVASYPNLIAVLLTRGYTEEQIEKICGKNALGVWQAARDYARAQTSPAQP